MRAYKHRKEKEIATAHYRHQVKVKIITVNHYVLLDISLFFATKQNGMKVSLYYLSLKTLHSTLIYTQHTKKTA